MISDMFLLETSRKGVYLVYAPRKMQMFAVNQNAAKRLSEYLLGKQLQPDDPLYLRLQQLNQSPDKLRTGSQVLTANITICPTFDCQLGCTYCFARGGEAKDHISVDVAKAGIDYVLEGTKRTKAKSSRLTWHGGGEPTLAWRIIPEITEYHQEQCNIIGIKPTVSIVSNGLWSKTMIDWFVSRCDRITISCDGSADIHDVQRPTSLGWPSSYIVYRTLKSLKETGAYFGIRSTITKLNVQRMPEMVNFFYRLCQPKSLHFEPLSQLGRCNDNQVEAGSTEDFIVFFKQAFDLAASLGISLLCSGISIGRSLAYYCGAAGRTFCITPRGLLTTCHRVDTNDDLFAGEFLYGGWDGKQFIVDQTKLTQLGQRYDVTNIPACSNCFCKYTCSGGCIINRLQMASNPKALDERCIMTKELTSHQLEHLANKLGLFEQII